MKKLFRTVLVLAAASFLLTSSCKKEEDDTTTSDEIKTTFVVSINGAAISNNATAFPDDSLSITVKATGTSKNTIKRMKLTSNNTAFVGIDTPKTGESAEIVVPFWPVEGTSAITFTATVTGSNDKTVTSTFVVNIADVGTSNPTLGNQKSSNPKFWSLDTDSLYDLSTVAANHSLESKMDVGYATRNAGNMLLSPASADATAIYSDQWSAPNEKITTWTVRNATKFKQVTNVTAGQLAAAASSKSKLNGYINAAIATGDPTLESMVVVGGTVVLMKTASGRYALINVINASGSVISGSATSGDIQIQAFYRK